MGIKKYTAYTPSRRKFCRNYQEDSREVTGIFSEEERGPQQPG